ncbi:MAG: Peptidase protein, partial [Pseudomonadota bacterium]|nr:Peptidase protein [Pseudomonadota bacterium]
MKLLKDSLEQLYQSQKLTPQEQRDAVIDVSRRGFLKQALSATLYGVA